ncbi:hypothetical protein C3B44_00565 [Corynebacterium yudongzhengii]|uniref:Uncharacterized protein n=1 Tax=Corynebacterium yudongzhengii TaxID=2080740 RepID=A0A2U1T5J6_9CORY|nr:hypothetical protein [Corynebacterium yudongzhengii]AWB81026.1 hypothetical protein C3B44_00565 [Corynebacterium yudongzhengii]PWC01271.1 hypothetical protein DF222_08225 [Corynebacterium yudongzhengii]
MSEHAVVAVVDKSDDDTVCWHVQTDPEAPSLMSGAWIVADAAELTAHAFVVEQPDTVAEIAQLVAEEVAKVREAAKQAKKERPQITLPRFDAPPHPDPEEIAETFHGEQRARQAWAMAVALAEIVEYWHSFESSRKQRSYLAERFGSEIRPLPLPQKS